MRPSYFLIAIVFAARVAVSQSLDEFFDGNQMQEIRIRMAPQDWVTIHEKFMENGYYRCDFEWKGKTVAGIGMRSRGSQSRSAIKPSIGLDFSRYTSTQRFLGLKTLVMRNLNQDASMMRERLAEALFRRSGLPYSREAHARLYVNGEYVGVYLLVEPIDERFIKTRFGEDTGFLYEVNDTQPAFKFEYRGLDAASYLPSIFDPKTRTSDPNTAGGIVEMVRLINEAPDAVFVEQVGKVVDLPMFLAHAAAEQVLAEWDGMLGASGLNNLYLYRWADGTRAMPLVWDQDGAFSDVNWSVWNETEANVLFRRSMKIPELRQRYLDAVRHSVDVMGEEGGWMDQEVEKIYRQIRSSVYEDPVRLCRVEGAEGGIGACTVEMFEESVVNLRVFAQRRAAKVRAEIGPAGDGLWLAPGSVSLGFDGAGTLVPGSIGYLAGKMPWTLTGTATALPLPQSLAGVSLETNEGAAELFRLDPAGIVFMVPSQWKLGSRSIRVGSGGKWSNSIMVRVSPTAATIVSVLHSNWTEVKVGAAARAGEVLVAFVIGAWPGTEKPEGRLGVRVDGVEAPVLWAGMAPGWIGLEQINFQVPSQGVGAGNRILQILYEGETGLPMLMPVQ